MITWGPIEPVESLQTRLRLDFGLRPAILIFNEWAVPGLGGAFFVRQLTWGCMGIKLADEMGKPLMAAKIAETLEAFASWIALKRSGDAYTKDDRVQGKRKFRDLNGLSFNAVNAGGAYVTVPFRRAATATLPGLGLCDKVEASFNSLKLTQPGNALAHAALSNNKAKTALRNFIESPTKIHSIISKELKQALLPGEATKEECTIIKNQLLVDGRRACLVSLIKSEDSALASLQTVRGQSVFLKKITDQIHRARLDACFSFEFVRVSALSAAQALAEYIKDTSQPWSALAAENEVQNTFHRLSQCCRNLLDKLIKLQDVPSEILLFCNEQGLENKLEQRIKFLAVRLPLVFSVLDQRLDRGLGYTDTLVAAEVVEATEGEVASNVVIPRPLLRLKRLYTEILIGAPDAT